MSWAIMASASWTALEGSGVSLHLRTPRPVNFQDFIWAAQTGDMEVIRKGIYDRQLISTDINTYSGETFLTVRLLACIFFPHIVCFF
jgi:hypothetical protein